MDWKTKTVSLAHPIKIGERTVREIKLREPDVDALEQIEDLKLEPGKRPTIRQIKGMVVAMGGEPAEVIGRVHRTDMEALAAAMFPLFTGEEETAKA